MIYAIFYTDKKYSCRDDIVYDQLGEFDGIFHYTRQWIEHTDLYRDNKELMDEPVGNGFWLWKPYIILQAMGRVNEGDSIFYTDAGDDVKPGIYKVMRKYMADHDYILTPSHVDNRWVTKRDCFILMGCDEDKYKDHMHLEAGTVVFKKTDFNMLFIDRWLYWNSIPQVVNEQPSILGEEPEGWLFHRRNQSILTNLSIKYNMEPSDVIKRFIDYNVFNA